MKSKPSGYHGLTICMMCISHMIFQSIQLCKGSSKEEGSEKILSRRRRYLTFPEGSSLQIVYDTYHPVVDYTNLLVVGITGALAWELPSRPVYPEEELQEIYKNGSLPLLRRNDGNVDDEHLRVKQSYQTMYGQQEENPKMISAAWPNAQHTSDIFKKYLSFDVNAPKNQYFSTKSHSQQVYQSFKKISHFPSQHQHARPMFRKRSASDDVILTVEENFNLENHRKTRHKLYRQLEKFIDTTGHHGKHCVLKALCETGQNKLDNKRRSFLGEIMKTIFSLPESRQTERKVAEDEYLLAHTTNLNCSEKFPQCSKNLWKTVFH